MVNFNPDLLPPDRREAAATRHREALLQGLRQRLSMERDALLGNALEALRTAGVVLAVLKVAGIYPASLWLIVSLFFAPPTWTALVMLAAMARHAWRAWRAPKRESRGP